MRKGQHWPISGGSAICGNSGVSVCVRSTTRMRPVDMALTRPPRISAVDMSSVVVVIALLQIFSGRPHEVGKPGGVSSASARSEFTLEDLGVVAPAFQPLLGHVAGVHVLDTAAQRLDDRVGQRARTQ